MDFRSFVAWGFLFAVGFLFVGGLSGCGVMGDPIPYVDAYPQAEGKQEADSNEAQKQKEEN